MKIKVNDQIYLSPFVKADKVALIECLNDEDIYNNTLTIPYPYTKLHADDWLFSCAGKENHWAIRNDQGCLIGGIGLKNDGFHRRELGYWLAKPYWNKGIMSAVVMQICEFAFLEMGIQKITANVFDFNIASAKVLEKCGFEQEGFLKSHYFKDNQFIDVKVFGLLAN